MQCSRKRKVYFHTAILDQVTYNLGLNSDTHVRYVRVYYFLLAFNCISINKWCRKNNHKSAKDINKKGLKATHSERKEKLLNITKRVSNPSPRIEKQIVPLLPESFCDFPETDIQLKAAAQPFEDYAIINLNNHKLGAKYVRSQKMKGRKIDATNYIIEEMHKRCLRACLHGGRVTLLYCFSLLRSHVK